MLEVLFVGTGDAFGSGGRRNSAILVRQRGRTILLDCGPTTLVGLRELGIDPREIDAIAISHFHGDHAAGIPFLLLDYVYGTRRETPLDLIGPEGIRERIAQMNEVFGYTADGERGYELRIDTFSAGTTVEAAGFQLTPEVAHHQPHTKPHMLRVETEDRALVFSGDTGWMDDLPEQVADVNLFISECTLLEEGFEYHLSHERMAAGRIRDGDRRAVAETLNGAHAQKRARRGGAPQAHLALGARHRR